MQIKQELSLQDDAHVYIGLLLQEIPNFPVHSQVVVKLQVRSRNLYHQCDIQKLVRFEVSFPIQVTIEIGIMKKLEDKQRHEAYMRSPRFIAFACIPPLMHGDIDRYVLVSELLGCDLKSLKYQDLSSIKKGALSALESLQMMHSPDENNESILHLDVKHENFCFRQRGREHIANSIDFGLSVIINNHFMKSLKLMTWSRELHYTCQLCSKVGYTSKITWTTYRRLHGWCLTCLGTCPCDIYSGHMT